MVGVFKCVHTCERPLAFGVYTLVVVLQNENFEQLMSFSVPVGTANSTRRFNCLGDVLDV